MKHKVVQAIYEQPTEEIILGTFRHPCTVTNEALSCLATLFKPSKGFSKLTLSGWAILDEKVSPTVIEQFTQHCQHL